MSRRTIDAAVWICDGCGHKAGPYADTTSLPSGWTRFRAGNPLVESQYCGGCTLKREESNGNVPVDSNRGEAD